MVMLLGSRLKIIEKNMKKVAEKFAYLKRFL